MYKEGRYLWTFINGIKLRDGYTFIMFQYCQCLLRAVLELFGGVIPYQADIGEGTIIGYQGLGVVIHKNCIIGKNCHIAQNVTMGGTSGLKDVPVLGNNVDIGAGANVIGPIRVGNNATIGAGAVVITDIPENAVAVGVPAKVVKYKNVKE